MSVQFERIDASPRFGDQILSFIRSQAPVTGRSRSSAKGESCRRQMRRLTHVSVVIPSVIEEPRRHAPRQP